MEAEETKKKAEKFKKSILEDDFEFLKGVELNKRIRQDAFNAVTKPIYKDPETGEMYTAVQKLELENSEEFLAKIGFLYTLTDGFKNLNGLINDRVKKEVKKGFSDLENKINTTRRTSGGGLKLASGVDDSNSYFGKGIKLDL
jgi:endonuclease III